MTAKQYLQDYKRLENNYIMAIEEYKNVEREMVSIKSPNLDGDRVQTSPQNDPIGKIVVDLEDEKAKIGIRIVKLRAQMTIVRNQISEMENTNAEFGHILLLRYVLYKDWKFICSQLNICRAQANIVHGKALLEFDSKYGTNFHSR